MANAERLDALMKQVHAGLRPGMEEKVQAELGALVGLLPSLRDEDRSHLVGLAEIAVSSLLLEQPDITLAVTVRERLEKLTRQQNWLLAMFRGGNPATTVILGLGVLLYFAIPALVIGLRVVATRETVFGIETEILLMVAFVGALGSIVSIMVRIQDFAGLQKVDASVLFFTGFFKPVIGASFAMFVFAALRSGLLPVTIQDAGARYFYFALSFVSGFSERFARDIVATMEAKGAKVGGSSTTTQGGTGSAG
jgi:hypothetical protein